MLLNRCYTTGAPRQSDGQAPFVWIAWIAGLKKKGNPWPSYRVRHGCCCFMLFLRTLHTLTLGGTCHQWMELDGHILAYLSSSRYLI